MSQNATEKPAVDQDGPRLPRGGECQCRGTCGLFFTSLSAFDAHQATGRGKGKKRPPEERPICRDPEEVGLVLHQRAGGPTWGLPGDPDREF